MCKPAFLTFCAIHKLIECLITILAESNHRLVVREGLVDLYNVVRVISVTVVAGVDVDAFKTVSRTESAEISLNIKEIV